MEKSNYLHGTNIRFNIGQVILPAKKAGVESNYDEYMDIPGKGRVPLLEGLSEHAFATGDEEEALSAADRAVDRKGQGEARIYRVSPVDVEDIDLDPNSSSQSGIRSRSGFRVEEEISTNNIRNLRFDVDGKAYFLHHSPANIKVGETIKTTGAFSQTTAADALHGYSYAWDAMNPSSFKNAMHNQAAARNIYITSADIENVFPDINVPFSSARAIKGEQTVLDMIQIGADESEESVQKRIFAKLESLNIPVRTKEEEKLANLEMIISDRGKRAASEHIEATFETKLREIGKALDNERYAPYEEGGFFAERGAAYRSEGLSGLRAQILREETIEEFTDNRHAGRHVKDMQEIFTAAGENAGKKLGSISKRTLKGIIEGGELAAQIMRFK